VEDSLPPLRYLPHFISILLVRKGKEIPAHRSGWGRVLAVDVGRLKMQKKSFLGCMRQRLRANRRLFEQRPCFFLRGGLLEYVWLHV